MNFGQLKEALARDVLKRDDVSESLGQALQFAHRDIQLNKDWRAMEARALDVGYTAGSAVGVVVAADYKRAREVYIKEVTGEEPDTVTTYKTVLPATEAEVNKLRRIAFNTRGLTTLPESGYIQRWYEAALRVVLMIPPADDIILDIEYYKYVDFYSDVDVGGEGQPATVDEATDWFSDNIPQVLLWGAAYYMSKYTYEDGRADHFFQVYQKMLGETAMADLEAKQSPQALERARMNAETQQRATTQGK